MKKLSALIGLFTALTCSVSQLASAGTALWQATPGSSASTNWSDTANWSNGLGPVGNDAVFGDTGAAGAATTICSVVDHSSLNPLSMTFTNGYFGQSRYHTVLLPAAVAMTNANGFTVGLSWSFDNYPTTVSFVGGGVFVQNGLSMTVRNASTSGTKAQLATLDLSGLSNFVYKASSGTLNVGGSGSDAVGSGQLNLAAGSNTITAGTISIVTGSGSSSFGTGQGGLGGTLNLGTGTNIINCGTFIVGAGRANNGIVQFLSTSGGLRLRGAGGTDADRVTILLGNRNSSLAGGVGGLMDFSGHPVDIKAATITLGQATTGNPINGEGNNGTLNYDTGKIDVNTLNMAINQLGNVSTTGEIDIGANALLIVNGPVSLATWSAGNATGNFNINGGTAQVYGNMTKNSVGASVNVSILGGVLNLAGLTNTMGTAAAPIDSLLVNGSTLTLPVVSGRPSILLRSLADAGGGNTINITALPATHTFPTEYPVIAYNPAGGGGSYDFTLGTIAGGYSGYITNDTDQSIIGLVITNAPTPRPVITNMIVSGVNVQFMGNNGPASQPFHLLATTNVGWPPVSWSNLATYSFDANGNFNFTIPVRTNRFSFFRLQVP